MVNVLCPVLPTSCRMPQVCCFPRAQVARLPIFNRRRVLEDLHLGITPDAFGAWPYGLKDMLAAALHPHSDDFIQTLLEAGRHDATHWAHATGLAPPGLPLPPRPPMPPLVLGARAGPATAKPSPTAAAPGGGVAAVSDAEATSEIAAEAAAAASLAAPLGHAAAAASGGGGIGDVGGSDLSAVLATALSRRPSTAAEAEAAAAVAAGTEAAQELLLQLQAHPQPEPREEPVTPQLRDQHQQQPHGPHMNGDSANGDSADESYLQLHPRHDPHQREQELLRQMYLQPRTSQESVSSSLSSSSLAATAGGGGGGGIGGGGEGSPLGIQKVGEKEKGWKEGAGEGGGEASPVSLAGHCPQQQGRGEVAGRQLGGGAEKAKQGGEAEGPMVVPRRNTGGW
ncbi:hypothetical protein Agub_g6866 [Astrephomene gubernaculifera]|uniref:Uncharacterized protein n=1 Tax=Astrephomene gubernaculifera TaxID=47775 RepID=A0AAD3DR70_9CHLO|nr:hypothetical protein Agub_g6866 [Astrephomene gubernaculifera]